MERVRSLMKIRLQFSDKFDSDNQSILNLSKSSSPGLGRSRRHSEIGTSKVDQALARNP